MSPLLVAVLLAQEPKLSITGDVQKPRSFSNADLQKSFAAAIQEVPFTLKGETGSAHAIPLQTILEAAAPKVDPKRKNGALSFAAVVSASDGYTATFSFGELMPDVGKREVWVALDWNGKPLEGADAPVRLIVTGDQKPSRWVHGVRRVKLVNLGK